MKETKQIADLLNQNYVREALFKQLSECMDISSLPYKIDFVSSEFFKISEDLSAISYEPTYYYAITGNNDSKEMKLTPSVIKIMTMMQPRIDSFQKYLNLLALMGAKKVFFRPFYDQFSSVKLTLFQGINNGIITRIADIKESDLYNIGK